MDLSIPNRIGDPLVRPIFGREWYVSVEVFEDLVVFVWPQKVAFENESADWILQPILCDPCELEVAFRVLVLLELVYPRPIAVTT